MILIENGANDVSKNDQETCGSIKTEISLTVSSKKLRNHLMAIDLCADVGNIFWKLILYFVFCCRNCYGDRIAYRQQENPYPL